MLGGITASTQVWVTQCRVEADGSVTDTRVKVYIWSTSGGTEAYGKSTDPNDWPWALGDFIVPDLTDCNEYINPGEEQRYTGVVTQSARACNSCSVSMELQQI